MNETTTATTETSSKLDPVTDTEPSSKLDEGSAAPSPNLGGSNPSKLGEITAENTSSKLDEVIEPDTFPREYVEKLRAEAAEARTKAKDRDTLAAALWAAQVAATGKLADPTDLAMPEGADPTDTNAVTAAVDALLAAKPHLASRKPTGDIGQGAAPSPATFDLLAALRAKAS